MALDCTAPDALDADPDIVGPGVLAAFFISAVVTIAAVLYALFLGVQDDTHPQSLNGRLIGQTREQLRLSTTKDSKHRYHGLDFLRGNYEEKKDILTKTILALSDQQLVTGLALMVAGLSDPNTISGYEYGVVLALAWFSSTTHLATLTALRKYLRSAGRVRDARVLGMVAILVLLSYLLFSSLPFVGGTTPIACGRSAESVSSLPVGNILALCQILLSYLARIHELYFGYTSYTFLLTLLYWRIRQVDADGLSYRELFAEHMAERRLRALLAMCHENNWLRRIMQAFHCYEASFLHELPGIAFSFSFGVAQLVWYRWVKAPRLEDKSNNMGFGQVLPLVLLLLPMLAAGESYGDYQAKKLDNTEPVQKGIDHTERTIDKSENMTATESGQDVQSSAAIFDECLSDVQKYLRRDVRLEIETASNDLELARRKAAIMRRYTFITDLERQVDVKLVYSILILNLLAMAGMGVALAWPSNSDAEDRITYGVAIPLFVILNGVPFLASLRSGAESVAMFGKASHTSFHGHPSRAALVES